MWEIKYQGKIIRGGFKEEGDYMVFTWGNGHSIRISKEEWEKMPKKRV